MEVESDDSKGGSVGGLIGVEWWKWGHWQRSVFTICIHLCVRVDADAET